MSVNDFWDWYYSKDMDPVPMQFHTALFGSIICISGMTFGQLYSVKQPV